MSQAAAPTLFLLHGLGMNAAEWGDVEQRLGTSVRCVALDLPGFGGRPPTGLTCADMATDVAHTVAQRTSAPWMIAGHSMGGKIAMIVTGMAEDGAPGLDGLTHLFLVASSTLEPEPMPPENRAEMCRWVADGTPPSHDHARQFIADNTHGPLSERRHDIAVASVTGSDPTAWRHWLERGSREDWTHRIKRFHTPTLIVAGADDDALGEDTQRRLNAPKFVNATVAVIAKSAHFIPLEQPDAVAAAWLEFIEVSHAT